MCELLVRVTGRDASDLVIGVGDVCSVHEDGHQWGRKEVPPLFAVVKLPGEDVREMQYLTQPDYDEDVILTGEVVRRRRVRLATSRLPRPTRTALTRDGEVTTTRNVVDDATEDKRTGQVYVRPVSIGDGNPR